MSEPIGATRPDWLLLATDLGAGCDRAMDRAAQLARQWQLPLSVVHATPAGAVDAWPTSAHDASPRQPPERTAAIERQLRQDLGEDLPGLSIHVAEGEPADVILELARREGHGLIVLGTARAGFADGSPGRTAERLVRASPASVLIVRQRPRGAYRHLLVGTDFTVESRDGLRAAASLFPQARIVLMHALDIPYQSLWLDAARRQEFIEMEMATVAAFLADSDLPEAARQRIHPLVEHGHPEIMLRQYVLEKGADLTVIGAFNRGLAFRLLIGGTAQRIVQTVPGDLLVVRATPAAG